MRLHVAIAVKDAVEYDVGSLHSGADGDVEDVVSGGAAAVEENLGSVGGEICRLGCALDWNALRDVDSFDGDATGILADADGLGGVDDAEIADPAVDDAVDLEAVEGLVGERDLSGWCDQTEVLDSDFV